MDVKLLHVEFGRAKFIKRAIRYSVIVKFRTEDNSLKKQEVWKRFEDFVYLKYELFKHIESAAETLPSFPDVPFWKFSDSTKVVKQRSSEITKLIDKIWNSPCLQESLPFKLFCQGLYTDTLGAKRRCTICTSSKDKIKKHPYPQSFPHIRGDPHQRLQPVSARLGNSERYPAVCWRRLHRSTA